MARTNTNEQTTVDMPETAWQQKSTHERTAMLVPLIGQRVRYIMFRDYRQGLNIYGPQFPKPWCETRLVGFSETGSFGRPGIKIPTQIQGIVNTFWGHVVTTDVAFDAIYDIEPLPEESEQSPATPGPDYDGADVYEADEVACPHCGERLRIVQRATVEKAILADGGDA